MRIVQVVHGFPPHEMAGTELATRELCLALQARGHQLTVFARMYDPNAAEFSVREEEDNGLTIVRAVHNYTYRTTFRIHYDNPFFYETFGHLLERQQPDIVHFQHVAHLSASLIPVTAALGYPTVLSLHDFFIACYRVHLIDRNDQFCPGPQQGERCVPCLEGIATAEAARHRFHYMTQLLHAPRRIIVPSQFLARRIVDDFPLLQGRLQVLPPGLPEVAAKPAEGGEQVQRRPVFPLRVLYLGILLPHKGAHVLVEALRGLPPGSVEVSLYGAQLPSRQTYVDQLHRAAEGLPVRFCGAYERAELGDILAEHDVCVIPSICEETYSFVTREALSAGLPVIASRRGALPEAVQDGENGFLFEPESAAELHRCLRRLVDEPGVLARLRAASFQWRDADAYARDIEQTYEELVWGRATSGEQKKPAGRVESGGGPMQEQPREQAGAKEAVVPGGTQPRPSARLVKANGPQTLPPMLSICLPTYNGEDYIEAALTSILTQSYTAFEVVIVDDGSTDRTLDLVCEVQDKRLRVYKNQQRRGIPGNWNECLRLARGEYVSVFHQDDLMLPNNLARKMELLTADPSISLVHSRAEAIIEAEAPTRLSDWMEKADTDFVRDGIEYFRKLVLQGDCICAPTVIARRELVLAAGGFDETLGYACDYEMWMKLCVGGRVGFLHENLVRYRWHARNASHVYQFERGVEECAQAMRNAVAYYREQTRQESTANLLAEAVEAAIEQRLWAAQLDRGRVWLEEQWRRWQELAEERGTLLQEQREWIEGRETVICEQQSWVAELEQSKQWLDEQRTQWQRTAEERTQIIEEQQAWIAELERGKQWLDEQWKNWQREAEERQIRIQELERTKRWVKDQWKNWQERARHWQTQAGHSQKQVRQWQESMWGRVGLRLGIIKPAEPNSPEEESEQA